MPATPLSPVTTPYYGGGQVAQPANVVYGIVSPPSNNAATGGGIMFINTQNGDVYVSYKPGSWSIAASSTGAVATLTGNSGGAISPVAGNINIVGAGGTLVSGAGSTLTITAAPQSFTWNDAAVSGALNVNNGYIITAGAQSFSLPALSNVGDEIALMLNGGASWTITQAAGQSIRVNGSVSTVGAGGSVATSGQGQTIWMICTTANLAWQALSFVGALTIV